MRITSFAEAQQILETSWPIQAAKYPKTIEHIRRFMEFLGNPQDKLKVIHVAGTSGKTSTAYYTAALLQAAGKKVGLTISPHVDELNERVQVNLVPMPEAEFCAALGDYLELVKQSGVALNHFEALYTFAIQQFVKAGVDYAVVEVGIGGLLDATNVVTRPDKVCVITDIGLDHMGILGDTIAAIAAQKAGIIQPHNAVFCYQQGPDVMQAIEDRVQKQQADLHVMQTADTSTFDFLPLFQQRNLGLAQAAADYTLQRDDAAALTGEMLAQAAHIYIPGRMEVLDRQGKTVVMDAAHNAQKLHALSESMHRAYAGQPVAALVSLVAARSYRIEDAVPELARLADHLIVTGFDGQHHSTDPQALAGACRAHGAPSVEVITDLKAALQALLQRPEPVLLITGSFFLLEHIRPLLRDDGQPASRV